MNWQLQHGNLADGTKVCVLTLTNGGLSTQVTVTPDDLEAIGRAMVKGAQEARTGLVIPAGIPLMASAPAPAPTKMNGGGT